MEKTHKPMKRHLLLLAAALTMSAAATAQSAYDNTHKYGLLSNLEIGASAQYTRDFASGRGNIGADLRLTKRIGTHWRLRAIADVPGFVANGTDRYGTAMMGLSADFLPFYLFADYGLSYNPSSAQRVNPAAEAGIGLHFDIGRNLRMFTEIGADLTADGRNRWKSNGFVKLGYAYSTGITEADRSSIEEKENARAALNELAADNRTMRAEVARLTEANSQLQSTLDRATAAIESSNQMLQNCKAAAEEKPATACDFTVYFGYASSEITDTDLARLRRFAADIADGNGYYRIDGYSSPDGNPYRNEQLSQERAEAVYWYLLSQGVDESRLAPIGNGPSHEYDGEAALNRIVKITKIAN